MNQDQEQKTKDYDDFVEKTWRLAIHLFMGKDEFSLPNNTEFDEYLNLISKEAEEISQINLQPWISILDLSIQWLSSLHVLISEARLNENNPDLLTPWVLTGAACSQAVAIRKLCLVGLDASAKIVLRSLVETLNICTVTIYDPTLRKRYQESQEFKDATNVWDDYFRDRPITSLISEIMTKLGIDDVTQKEFLDWQKEEKRLLNQVVHTSYIAAALSTYVQSSDQRTFPLAIFGASTILSVRTLAFASRSIWLFSMMGFYLLLKPLDTSQPLLKPNPKDHWTKINASSHFVLNQVIQKYWQSGNIDGVIDSSVMKNE